MEICAVNAFKFQLSPDGISTTIWCAAIREAASSRHHSVPAEKSFVNHANPNQIHNCNHTFLTDFAPIGANSIQK